MFREMMRKKQALSLEECKEILKTETRGVLSVMGENGYPYGMPMNHFYNETDGCLYFHCGKKGHRLDALKENNKVSFCVYDKGFRRENEWAWNVKSVIVFGRMDVLSDAKLIMDICEKLSYKFTDDTAYIEKELRESAKNTLLLRLTPEHISGKLVNEA
ncbi:MAG: pyridoxamine 5'-phosphate oxidase family protein [Clostridia bacterium]|nr:pyridoxamine 5'-phosphate oxidase family protein [Clostridia bacterium]